MRSLPKTALLIGLTAAITLFNRCTHDPLIPFDIGLIGGEGQPCDPDSIYFVNDVLPILSTNCAIPGCHDAATAEEGLILDSYDNVIGTTEIKPEDPNDSEIIKSMNDSDPDDVMPPPDSGLSLTADQIQTVTQWIAQGATNNACNEDLGGCDSVNVSFAFDVTPIINTHCKGCHSGTNPGGDIRLENYTQIRVAVDDASLLGSIQRVSPWEPMPKNQDPLSDCKIAKIKSWIDDGAPDN